MSHKPEPELDNGRITIELSDETMTKLELIAQEKGESLEELINSLLESLINQK